VTYHPFCQTLNVLHADAAAMKLLESAGVQLTPLPEAKVCCGFGGSTSFDAPEVSQGIVERKLTNVDRTGASVLVTDNPGCVLHLRGAARASGRRLRVMHFAELLAERLQLTAPDRS
jgi:Fe-S oxidoreductase